MLNSFDSFARGAFAALAGVALFVSGAGSAVAQVRQVDPDQAIDGDLVPQARQDAPGAVTAAPPPRPAAAAAPAPGGADSAVVTSADPARAASQASADPVKAGQQGATYREDDLIGAAEGVFGKGAHGLADIIKGILTKQGEPNGYIVGREGGGAIVFGLRYGSGTMYHKVEGQQPVYWTGPSIGFDAGANAASSFILVYNLYDSADLFHRYGAGEGQAYLVGGFNVSYLRRRDVVLIPVRMGVGLRLGLNAGYMKFSRKANWMPF
ncbi:MAG: DUF1134 domain-containing protein [Pseudomonadota bacterium]